MILTINPNAALDRVMFIDEYHPATDMYVEKTIECIGGKGLDSSVVLQSLNVPNVAMSFVAGANGRQLAELLDEYKIEHDLVWVEGETRIAHVIVEKKHHRQSHVTTRGYKVKAPEQAEFMKRFDEHVQKADWVICAGSIPEYIQPDLYKTITERAALAGAKTLIDCKGKPMVHAIEARPAIVKMNRSEFKGTFNVVAGDLKALTQQANSILRQYQLPSIVITCGEDGILAITPDQSFLASGPILEEVNSAGAGDAVSAALAWRFSVNDPWETALRWAVAASGAVVLTEGTADCNREDVDRIFPNTKVQLL